MSEKFKQGLADRIYINKKTPIWIALLILVFWGVGVYLSPSQWYWGVGFVFFFLLMFGLRMYAWKLANEPFELTVFLLPTLVLIGTLIMLYLKGNLTYGVALQIIAAAPFSIILLRSLLHDKINNIAAELRNKYNQ